MQKLQSLKNKILTLAIQGKLVPQTEMDKPVSVLLQKIQKEKEQLIKEKKLKKDTLISSVIYKKGDKYFEKIGDTNKDITDNIPFDIPDSWQWVRLGVLLKKIGSGSTPKGGRDIYSTSGIKFIRSQNVLNSGLQLKDIVYITDEINNQKKNSVVLANDVLINITGASIGRCAVVPSDFDLANINQHVMILRLLSIDVRFWIHLAIISDFIQSVIMSVQNGSSKEALTIDKINQFLIPLPPLEEQERIVQRVQELFAKIDLLEKTKQELDDLKAAFKNKMLSLAIQGKLVPQVETDEPVSVLLQQIQTEKEKLIKEKKLKKDTVSSIIYKTDNRWFEKIGNIEKDITKEIPFEIPKTWQWVRLGNICNLIMGQSPEGNTISNENNGLEFHQGKLFFGKKFLLKSDQYAQLPKKIAPQNSILLCVRAPVGQINITKREVCIGRGLCCIDNIFDLSIDFLFYWLLPYEKILMSQATGSTFMSVTLDKVENLLFPLPPLEEQRRITQKIEKIFTLCQKL